MIPNYLTFANIKQGDEIINGGDLAFDKDDIPTSPILSDDEDERPDFSQARLDVVEVK